MTPTTWSASPFLSLGCLLGEGPYYESATQTLRFVDIKKKQVHTVPVTIPIASASDVKTLSFDIPVTVTADITGVDPCDRILVGAKYGVAVLDRNTGGLDWVARWAESGDKDNERLRSNDGGVDPNGRFWVGTMTDFGLGDFQPEGRFQNISRHNDSGASYLHVLAAVLAASTLSWSAIMQFERRRTGSDKKYSPQNPRLEGSVFTIPTDPKYSPRRVFRSGFTIPNTVGWSPDGMTMYITHSSARTIFAYSYDPAVGSVSPESERIFYSHPGAGEPDGFRVDTEGNLWHAVYGEGKVLRITPEGKVTGEVRLPTANITCVEFVGTELFITSAADEGAQMGPVSKEMGGAIFRVDVGARGLDRFKFKLDV
ncbi:hypothetical protein MKZ38_009659 [Zalerion maritima]|uniref:SMP-30/Gluconolactonase/LRE-like region domain-containing protein n=1 Tax=Zalerion maritima TaxID=339359 RepID=A0AAD5RFU9_9PEZI|nr:hypothetical protein MKZ38_009659 [Zalerion maritima]